MRVVRKLSSNVLHAVRDDFRTLCGKTYQDNSLSLLGFGRAKDISEIKTESLARLSCKTCLEILKAKQKR